jgi:CubicO group peptidase (beta-lactamase class C family)
MRTFTKTLGALLALLLLTQAVVAQTINPPPDIAKKLGDFDAFMAKLLKDWNAPGVGVGIVVKDKLVFAKGYGYRDYDKKLPITPDTRFQIASNTKLFTSIAAGLLVEEGKLDWDKPIKQLVPEIEFYNADLNNSVSLRDMLGHRTGISRHDLIWFQSDFTRKELFQRLKYLEPSQPIRTGFLYNNMMYVGVGYAIELKTGQTWEDFTAKRIFQPLGMTRTLFSVSEMTKDDNHFVPYREKRDTTILIPREIYDDGFAVGPAGSIISTINDMSKWVITLMNEGSYNGKQVIPKAVVRQTLSPGIALRNTELLNKGFGEVLNSAYGMGRQSASYRGHWLAYHGGDLPGIHSQVSLMPTDSIGVIVFAIGEHTSPLYNLISFNVYERLLGMSQTPWAERRLKEYLASKKAEKETRKSGGAEKVPGTKPSHPLADYAGLFDHPAYGELRVNQKGDALELDFHKIKLPLTHFHYDRFDTPNDEVFGVLSLSFNTNPQGELDGLRISLDESEVTFKRKADPALSDSKVLAQYAGKYTYAGQVFEVALKPDGKLFLQIAPALELIPYKPHTFQAKGFADIRFTFDVKDGKAVKMYQRSPEGTATFDRKAD